MWIISILLSYASFNLREKLGFIRVYMVKSWDICQNNWPQSVVVLLCG